MVTPLATTTTSLGKVFPLFNSLLKEGRTTDSNPLSQRCPATAPILGVSATRSDIQRRTQRQYTAMSKEATSGSQDEREDVAKDSPGKVHTPIILQDPPVMAMSKLKRQLSIDTADRSDAQRVRKKQHVEETHGALGLLSDEVDGGPSTSVSGGLPTSVSGVYTEGCSNPPLIQLPDTSAERRPMASYITSTASRQFSTDTTVPSLYVSDRATLSCSPSKQSGNVLYKSGSTPSRQESLKYPTPIQDVEDNRHYYREQKDQGLLSPGHFNLSDFCQTSPFVTNPQMQKKQESVFIFPDQTTPKKVSPYAPATEQPSGSHHQMTKTSTPPRPTQRQYSKIDRDLQDNYVTDRRQLPRSDDSDTIPGIQYPPYVSPKGFVWPSVAPTTHPSPMSPRIASSNVPMSTRIASSNVPMSPRTASSKVPMSPRIASSNVRPHYPINQETSSRSVNRNEGSDDDYARLCMLTKEYARALKTYGYHPRESETFRPREISDVIRNERFKTQRSAEEHSPNEKAIREIQDDVHNKYERSISDPLYSPRTYRQILRRASRCFATRDRLHAYDDNEDDVMEKGDERREPWRQEYRRRLFMKDETYGDYDTERRRPQFDYDTHLVTGNTEIPKDVLDFLHSLNFHPEQLENLKDYIRRGASESLGFPRMTSSHLEGQDDHLRPPLPEAEFHRRSPNERQEADFRQRQFISPQRERQLGDINLRLSCSNIKEKGNQQSEPEKDVTDCKCARIENEIRAMAMDAYSKIRRLEEFDGTNTNVFDSMRVLHNIKSLCNHGRTVEDIYTGSVMFTINCPDIDALLDLWSMYKSGNLLKLMQDAFITDELKQKYGLEDIELKVAISKEEYLTCKHELEVSIQQKFPQTPQTPQKSASFIHARSRSEPASMAKQAHLTPHAKSTLSPFRERFRSDSSVELSPRRVFQQINTLEVPAQPHSPSKKFFPDNVFADDPPRSPLAPISPTPSPRKKSFGTKLQFQEQQQENVEQNPDKHSATSGTAV